MHVADRSDTSGAAQKRQPRVGVAVVHRVDRQVVGNARRSPAGPSPGRQRRRVGARAAVATARLGSATGTSRFRSSGVNAVDTARFTLVC
jgi:hypothetical protein